MILHDGPCCPGRAAACRAAGLATACLAEWGLGIFWGMIVGEDSCADSLAVPKVFGRMPNVAAKMAALPISSHQVRTQAANSSLPLYLIWSVVHSLGGMSQRLPI